MILVPGSQAHDEHSIEQRQPADPKGLVDIVNLSGSIDVRGWDRAEVEVTGTVDDSVEKVDVATVGDRTSIRVVRRSDSHHGGEVSLVIHVPAASALTASLVSSDLILAGVRGDAKLQTVSGDVSGEIGGDLRATTVSGSVTLTARAAHRVEVKTISGDVHLTGAGGEVEITTVSGSSTAELASVTRGRFKTVSGTMSTNLALAADAEIESESVSGDVAFRFAAVPDAQFDVQSFSGDIRNCFGPKPTTAQYGPGSRLAFASGSGHSRVRIESKSGDIKLCSRNAKDTKDPARGAVEPIADFQPRAVNPFYVL